MAETVLSADYKTAVTLDQQIKITAANMVQNYIDLCGMLYEMSNKKLYKELGYQTFEDYSKTELGITKQQGHKYLKIGKEFSDEKVKSTLLFENLGTEKLYLLAKLDEPDREEIQQIVNVEDVSVKKLKAEIAKLKDDNDKIRSAKISMESDLLSVKSNNRSLRHQLDDAEKKIADLESRPVEVAVIEDKDAKAQINLLSRELAEVNQEYTNNVDKLKRKYQDHINELEEQLEKMSEQAEQKEIIEKVDNTAVFDVYVKMIDKIIFSMGAHIAKDIDVGNKMIYNHQINELIRRLEKCLKK